MIHLLLHQHFQNTDSNSRINYVLAEVYYQDDGGSRTYNSAEDAGAIIFNIAKANDTNITGIKLGNIDIPTDRLQFHTTASNSGAVENGNYYPWHGNGQNIMPYIREKGLSVFFTAKGILTYHANKESVNTGKKPITVFANNITKTYGDEIALDGTEFYVTRGMLEEGDSIDSATLCCDGLSATSSVKEGGYDIIPSNAVGTGLNKYDITYRNGNLQIDQFKMTVQARNQEKTYSDFLECVGDEYVVVNPDQKKLPIDINPFNADNVPFNFYVTLTSDGCPASAEVGEYVMSASNAVYNGSSYYPNGSSLSGNYDITYESGKLFVIADAN